MDYSILVHCTRYSGCSMVHAGRDIIYIKDVIVVELSIIYIKDVIIVESSIPNGIKASIS